MFRKASLSAFDEMDSRKNMRSKLLKFGVKFLDDSLDGVLPGDLVLIGAPPGVGKTQFCCNLAYTNIRNGKKVHYFALEAEQYEIERRIKYQIFADAFFKDNYRPKVSISFDKWYLGDFLESCSKYETIAAHEFAKNYEGLFLYYKGDDFRVETLIEQVLRVSRESDLIIIDHAHYFDFDDDNENRAMKSLAKTARTLALEEQKPIVLIAHLRKRDKFNAELVPGMEEFHGTSDLYKIATRVITFAPGPKIQSFSNEEVFATFFRVPKNRINGSVTRYLGAVPFHVKGSQYGDEYKISWANVKEFEELARDSWPPWAKRSSIPVSDSARISEIKEAIAFTRGQTNIQDL